MSIIKGTVYLTIGSFFFLISGYIINIWLGRFLGPTFYGYYGVVISLMTVVNIMQTSGLPQAVAKFISEDQKEHEEIIKSAFVIQFISTLLITLGVFLLADEFANLLHDPHLSPYIRISAFVYPFYGIYALYLGYYNGLHDFKKQAKISTIYAAAKIISVIGLGYFFHLYGALEGFIVAAFIATLFGFHIPKTSKTFPYKKLLNFSLPLIGFAVLSVLQSSVDLFFIKSLLHNTEGAGYFTASQNIARIPYFGLSAFASVLFPSISASVSQKDHTKTKKIINDSLRYILILLIPATLLISATSPQLVSILYSQKYLPAAQSLAILTFGYGFLTLFGIFANILNGGGSPKTSMLIAGLGAITNALLCWLLIPHYGLTGAAIATTIGGACVALICAYKIYKKFGILTNKLSIIRVTFCALITYFVSVLINTPTLLLPLKLLLLGLIYLALLALLKELKPEDKSRIQQMIPARLKKTHSIYK